MTQPTEASEMTAAAFDREVTSETRITGSGEIIEIISTEKKRVASPQSDSKVAVVAAAPPEMPKMNLNLPETQKVEELLRASEELFHAVTNWVDFYRMVFGVKGLVELMYPTVEAQSEFSHTAAYAQLQAQLSGLRERDTGKAEEVEPQRMITIRVPKSIHDRLVLEADWMDVSVNRLCISKLIHLVEPNAVPKEKGRRRGRRPGPQKQTRGKKNEANQ